MNYIVFDLEWNQCPDGKEKEEPLLPFEIIEIGAVKMNSQHEVLDQYHEIIRPQVYPVLHFMTREVISLNETELTAARCFSEVIADFLKWCGEEPVFATWGPSDLTELQRNMAWYHIPSPLPFPLFYYDVQKIFSIVYEDRKSRRSLETAVDYLSILKTDIFHNALSDAVYTAKVMEHLTDKDVLSNSSIDYYRTPANRRQEIHITYQTYYKFISKPFNSKTDAMKDRVVTSTKCYSCGQNTRKKIRWFSSGNKNYYCLAWCENHGWLKGKIRLRQHHDGSFYVIKTLRLVNEEEAYSIRERQEIQRLRRRLKHTYKSKGDDSSAGGERARGDGSS
ncbi:MAG: exonuclease domain-containing protein [Lachnospiraceae bacterium]|nr:exonuclease domain-containing protein [Lachnospiraceae bacterium]